jgi:diphosphomevalonate decarboxylase
MTKITAVAPSNIAFIKYWGKKDEVLRLPENGSISMNLSDMFTTTTVEFDRKYNQDDVLYNGEHEDIASSRAVIHLDRIRKLAGILLRAKVVTQVNFPPSTGLSSSASGFAALTLAGSKAAGLNLSEKELSILARQGSGSACRSVPDGFVEWLDGETSDTSYSVSLYSPEYWDLVDVVAVVTSDKKDISTTEGMKNKNKSPYYETRLDRMPIKLSLCHEAIRLRDFEKLGALSELEALEMHAIMITQTPPLLYWTTGTLLLMKLVQKWRQEGLSCYFTINTGQNIHILTLPENAIRLKEKLQQLDFVKQIIINHPARGARISNTHLF